MEQATLSTTDNRPVFSSALRAVATVISYITHPLFIPLIITFLIVRSLPEYFVAFAHSSKRFQYDTLYIRVLTISIFFPVLTLMLARSLKFVESIQMHTQRDRIIPYVACTIYYFWAFYAFKREGVTPPFFNAFFLGVFLAVVLSMVGNTYAKISMHTTGWGGVIGLLLMLMTGMHMNVSFPLVVTILIAGVVATARLILSAHTPAEIYTGFIIGILSQWIAYGIVG
ncbi:hypothetical protein SAMN05428988_2247 [Chitinophaga sp. YR573]|uniref:phosphatase PAP2 family protein n=1 Tax=Chitinophaga sp. YR573 TaxID=1881040 RepID=UPI0008CEE244|nr:phosphatase PAP2 family protein [Chitinophaga sp. YR573]SEW12032.1 hypothetical protein SAMN05428988_2247 [Chitinophaga sp. YR573]